MEHDHSSPEDDLEPENLERYMRLSAEEKLVYLQEMTEFLAQAMPPSSKKAWQALKKQNW